MSERAAGQGHGGRRVLVCGASFAGLAMAWWMRRLGYGVTVVERAPGLRKGGTPVDIREGVVEVVRRMGLLERIAASSLPKRTMQFLSADGVPLPVSRQHEDDGYEIERDALLDILFDEVRDGVEFLFGETIAELEQSGDGVRVVLKGGGVREVALVFGCDGVHSAVRRLCFGEEAAYLMKMQACYSLSIVNGLLLEEDTSQLFNVPGKTVMLNAYNGKTDIGLAFATDGPMPYDRRDEAALKRLMRERFAGEGWRVPELLDEVDRCENFYFDELCQIRMGRWTAGRVALVGDAGYCPSPAAGMGGSMAILGAASLGEAFARHGDDFVQAFAAYEASLRPVVEAIQKEAVDEGMTMFLPRTEEALRRRNAQLGGA